MDLTNCSAYLATDIVFEQTPIGTCDTNYVVFCVYTGFFILLRTFNVIINYKKHFNKLHNKKKSSPTILYILTGLLITYYALLIGIIGNFVNVHNGFSYSLFSATYAFFGALTTLAWYRMVRLGLRIGSFKDPNLLANSRSLEKFDKVGSILASLSIIALFASSLVLIVLSPILLQQEILLGVIGFAFKGIFQTCLTFGYVWQVQRCLSIIRIRMPDGEAKKAILSRLRFSQMIYLVFGLLAALFYWLLTFRVFLWTWWSTIGILLGLETLAATIFACNIAKALYHQSQHHSKSAHPIENQNEGEEEDEPAENSVEEALAPLGLGIRKSKFKKKKFTPKISRVTEVSERTSGLDTDNVGL